MSSYEEIRARAILQDTVSGSGVGAFITRGMSAWISLIHEMPELTNANLNDSSGARNEMTGAIHDEMIQLLVSLFMNQTKEVAYVC